VDAIEQHYVPVLVRNNVGGREKQLLAQFGEPTWANPSARVVDPKDERTLVKLSRNYSTQGVLEAAAAGLRASKAKVPTWLSLHLGSGKRAQATFGMACFWTGEVRLGGLPGVISTRTGWRGSSEVVEVEFDPQRISRAQLEAKAKRMSCAQPFSASAPFRATPQDDKYQIRRGVFRLLPLSPTQATRINARVGRGAEELLSPRQRELLALIKAHPKADWPVVLGQPLRKAWVATGAVAAKVATPRD